MLATRNSPLATGKSLLAFFIPPKMSTLQLGILFLSFWVTTVSMMNMIILLLLIKKKQKRSIFVNLNKDTLLLQLESAHSTQAKEDDRENMQMREGVDALWEPIVLFWSV
jgi:hypothetical protein